MRAKEFNKLYPVGTRFKYIPILGCKRRIRTKTRSEAWDLGYGDALVKIEGRSAGVDITHLEPA